MSEDVKPYDKIVEECAITRRDLDTILHPTFGELKKAAELLLEQYGFGKSDFKRLSDMVYYQGGYPSPNSPPKEVALADLITSVVCMEELIDRNQLVKYLAERGIEVKITRTLPPDDSYQLTPDERDDLKKHFQAAGVNQEPVGLLRTDLKMLVDRAQELQAEICQTADTIKVDAAEIVEEEHKIKKPYFIKAVNFGALKLRRGEGAMAEKLDDYLDNMENAELAVEPLKSKES